jgi:hypothetical protein
LSAASAPLTPRITSPIASQVPVDVLGRRTIRADIIRPLATTEHSAVVCGKTW